MHDRMTQTSRPLYSMTLTVMPGSVPKVQRWAVDVLIIKLLGGWRGGGEGDITIVFLSKEEREFNEGLVLITHTHQPWATLTVGKEGFTPILSPIQCLHSRGEEWRGCTEHVLAISVPCTSGRCFQGGREETSLGIGVIPRTSTVTYSQNPTQVAAHFRRGNRFIFMALLRHHWALINSGQMLHPELWKEPVPLPYFTNSLSQSIQRPWTFKSSPLAGVASSDGHHCVVSKEAHTYNQLHSLHFKTRFLTTRSGKRCFGVICLQSSGLLKLPPEMNHLGEHWAASLPGETGPVKRTGTWTANNC